MSAAPEQIVLRFVHELAPEQIPAEARHHAARCLLDLAGVAVAARSTRNSQLVHEHVAECYGAGSSAARMLGDGRRVSLPGAAMAGAATIDSLDAHDGHKPTKGHVGVVVLPAAAAFSDEVARCSGAEFATRLVLGYEIASRAGVALHATVPDYHTSGAWNALAAAAIGARALALDAERTWHALGTAEYYGPRSQMMRCIDHPTMVKDGATYGAHAGVSAALLAARGFTGAPAITVCAPQVADLWADLGSRWRMCEQYVKAYPVCRWAQPAVEAVRSLMPVLAGRDIERITITTFHEGTRLLMSAPADTEQAQYAIAFPVAAMLATGRLDADTVTSGLADPRILALLARIEAVQSPEFDSRFPAERLARVTLRLADGTVLESPVTVALGDPEAPLSDATMEQKFFGLAEPVLGRARATQLRDACLGVFDLPRAAPLLDALCAPVRSDASAGAPVLAAVS